MSNYRNEGIFSTPWIPSDMPLPASASGVKQITGAPPGYARSQVVSAASGLGGMKQGINCNMYNNDSNWSSYMKSTCAYPVYKNVCRNANPKTGMVTIDSSVLHQMITDCERARARSGHASLKR